MHLWYRVSFLALAAAACGKADGSTPAGDVTVEATLPPAFGQVSNVVELDRERVAFAGDRHFVIGSFVDGSVDTVGLRTDSLAEGSPTSVYKFAGWVAHLAGDTVALVDFAAIRTTLWNEQGQPLAPLELPPVGGATPVLAYDHQGFGYKSDFTSVLGTPEPGGVVRSGDSVPVLRIRLASGRVDTVGHLSPPVLGDARFGEETRQVATIFGPNDMFGALPDGRLWIARARENRLEWRGPGGVWIRGKPRRFDAVPVTDADRARVLDRIRMQASGQLPQGIELSWPFAEHKPPFDNAVASPAGEVWFQRSRPLDGTEFVYDVFGPDAEWTRAVRLPANTALAGFGENGAIYAVVKDGEQRRVVRLKEKKSRGD
jgi:hypothetical protein